MSTEASASELMAVVLARALRDDEWGACGAYSAIPMTAFMLARRQHAPNLWWMSGGGGGMNPRCTLVESSSDYRVLPGSEAVFTIEEVVDFEFGGWRRIPNVGLFGGIQVDRRGSVNMVGLGPYPKLNLRGPGTVGLAFGAHFHRAMIYLNRHESDILCEQVDYVCSPGHTERQAQHTRPHVHGPDLIVTPQAVFDFDAGGLARLASISPGYSERDVRAHTGFHFATVDGLGETEPPTPEQLSIIREEIDPRGVLARVDLKDW
jgi:glutaconate CoA-transferase subunit B